MKILKLGYTEIGQEFVMDYCGYYTGVICSSRNELYQAVENYINCKHNCELPLNSVKIMGIVAITGDKILAEDSKCSVTTDIKNLKDVIDYIMEDNLKNFKEE